ncbi:MAG: HAMP domain-containing sensor histidine kinase [Pseudomonadota bacterium]
MPPKTLHELIHENADRIVEVFVGRARRHELPPPAAVHSEVVDDLNRFVRELALAFQLGDDDRPEEAAKAHGGQRWYAGYDLRSVLLEYEVLRSAIGDVVAHSGYEMTTAEVDRVAQLVNCALAEAAVEFTLRATERVNEALRIAEQAVRAREEVIAVVSHDLKSPLSVIYGSVAMLDEELSAGDLEAQQGHLRAHVARIRRSSVRMNRLITDLLDLAKVREGQVEIEVREERTRDLLAEARDQSAPLAEQRPVQLVNGGGPDGVVICDRERVLQVFDNIVGNAIKFSSPGETVRLSVECSANECIFAVRDTGPGIPEQQLPLLFDRFWTSPRVTGGSGTGLGLAIARGIVEAHGGRIWVESAPGAGTSFFFSLPTASGVRTKSTAQA